MEWPFSCPEVSGMNAELDCVVEERESNQGQGPKQLSVEWTESEWFRIYLQLARKEQQSDSN